MCQPYGQEPGAWEGPQVLFLQNLKMLSPCLRLALLSPESLCVHGLSGYCCQRAAKQTGGKKQRMLRLLHFSTHPGHSCGFASVYGSVHAGFLPWKGMAGVVFPRKGWLLGSWDDKQDQQRAPPCWLSSLSELQMCRGEAQEGQRWIDSILYPLPCLPPAPISSLLPAPSCVPSFPLLSVFLSISSPHTLPHLRSAPQGTSSLVTEC